MRTLTIFLILIVNSLSPSFFGGMEAAASVVLKMLVTNPSETDSQSVPVKVYLPKEVSPKDILDLGDLKLDYDPDTGMYYVHDTLELRPGQSVTKKVEMEDVWVFTEEQLETFVNESKEMARELEGGPYAAEAAALVVGIEEKVVGILMRQEETAANPREHIQAYRQGITLISTIEQDVAALETLRLDSGGGERQGKGLAGKDSLLGSGDTNSRIALRSSSGAPESGAPLGRSISMTTAWRMIFAILAFLAVLSVIFFLTWHRLQGTTMANEQQAVPLATGLQEVEGTENNIGPRPE